MRLGQRIDWRHAVALSDALQPRLGAPTGSIASSAPGDDDEGARIRVALVSMIEGDPAFSNAMATAGRDASADATFYRQRYLALQQIMEAEIGHVRARLRRQLEQRTASAARFATTDALMEWALSGRERALLAPVPDLIDEHSERLRAAAQAAPDSVASTPRTMPMAWQYRFAATGSIC